MTFGVALSRCRRRRLVHDKRIDRRGVVTIAGSSLDVLSAAVAATAIQIEKPCPAVSDGSYCDAATPAISIADACVHSCTSG